MFPRWKALNLMIRTGLPVVLLLSLSAMAHAATPTPPPGGLTARITQIDTTQFPRVVAYVSVVDAAGEPAVVSPAQLALLENGQPVSVDEISGAGDIGPLATILVIDTSGSMNSGEKLQAAKAAAKSYVRDARAEDLIGILAFNTEIKYVQPLTADRAALATAIDGLRAHDDTAMYDALAEAMQLIASVDGRKAIIVMTDGLDNRSKLSGLQLVQSLGAAGLTISTIGLGDASQSQAAVTALDEAGLKALAQAAGGQYGYAGDAEALRGLYERYGRALQSEYVIAYTSPLNLRDGVNRALSVTLAADSGASAAAEPVRYNPGGLVPEVDAPASWSLFGGLLIALAALLVIPLLVLRLARSGAATKEKEKAAARIKLETAAAPAPKKPPSGGNVKLKG